MNKYIISKKNNDYILKPWIGNNVAIYLIPRNGHNSIKIMTKDFGYSFYTKNCNNIINDKKYKKITILRNPLERYISCYIWLLNRIKKREGMEEMCDNELVIDFIDLTKDIEKIGVDNVSDPHFVSQYYYLTKAYKRDSIVPIDYYFSIENIKKDFPLFKKITKIDGDVRWDHKAFLSEKKDIIKKYLDNDKEILNKINNMYSKDWKLYKNKIIKKYD